MLTHKKTPSFRWRFFLYHLLWRASLLVAEFFKEKLPFKLKAYLDEREIDQIVWRCSPRSEQRRIWFHAASGEIEYIKPVLRLWRQQHPDDLLFLTYFSTSARKMISSLPEIDGWAPLPMDLPDPCERFIAKLNPSILIISRTDLWPTLLHSLGNKPKMLVASTWAEGSKKTQGLGRWMTQWCLEYLDDVGVVSTADAEWVKAFSPKANVSITGDPRFDQVEFRLQQQRALPDLLKQWSQQHSILIAGSTWEEDERVLLPAWISARTINANPDRMRLLIVPHETHQAHLKSLASLMKELGLDFSLWSSIKNQTNPIVSPVIIFDEKGWLAELYQLGDLAFIGGSFKSQVHSVMEAFGCGLPVIVGPHYRNNREAMEFANLRHDGQNFLTSAADSESLTRILIKHWHLPELSSKELRAGIRQEFSNRCHAATQTYKEILRCLS